MRHSGILFFDTNSLYGWWSLLRWGLKHIAVIFLRDISNLSLSYRRNIRRRFPNLKVVNILSTLLERYEGWADLDIVGKHALGVEWCEMSEVFIPGPRWKVKPELKCFLYLVIFLDRVVELAPAVDHFIVCGDIYLVTHMSLIYVIIEHPCDELLLDDELDRL